MRRTLFRGTLMGALFCSTPSCWTALAVDATLAQANLSAQQSAVPAQPFFSPLTPEVLYLDVPPASATAPASQESTEKMRVVVEEVRGKVRVRTADDQPWKEAVVGMVVDEGAEFQTGHRSYVRCSIPPDQTFVLDRLGTVKVLTSIRNGNKVTTDMLMKYGRTKYNIEAAGLDHSLTVASPSATMAVRGTDCSLYDQPPYTYSVNTDHVIQIRDAHRQVRLGTNNTKAKVSLAGNQPSAAATALAATVTDPRYGLARTQAENVFIAQQISRGGVVSFDPLANILVVRDSNPITNDAAFAKVVPQPMSFTVRWTGNSDVNLGLFSQFGDPLTILNGPNGFQPTEYLYPGYGLNISKRGGTIPFDDRGGPNGGTEVAYYKSVINGFYGLSATLISGGPTVISFNVYVNRQPQYVFGTDANSNIIKAYTLKLDLTNPGDIQTAFAVIPDQPLLDGGFPTQVSTSTTNNSVTPAVKPGKRTAPTAPTPAVNQPVRILGVGGVTGHH